MTLYDESNMNIVLSIISRACCCLFNHQTFNLSTATRKTTAEVASYVELVQFTQTLVLRG